jgi:hypothetical protein
MKRSVLLILAAAALLAGGCDFVRTVAGRPTSDDLEVKRSTIERAQNVARYQARLDSLERVRQREEESLAALDARVLDSLEQAPRKLLKSGFNKEPLDAKYHVIVAAYSSLANAERKVANCIEAGYPARIIVSRSGLNAVGICPSNHISETMKWFRELRGNGICPPDGWILVNE